MEDKLSQEEKGKQRKREVKSLTTGQNIRIELNDGLLGGLNYSLKDGLTLSKKKVKSISDGC